MMQDLVNPESCGVANPVAQLGNLAQMGGQAADARQYGDMMGKQAPGIPAGPGAMMDQMQPQVMQQNMQAEQFAQRFEQQGMAPRMRQHPMMQNMGNDMAQQFSQMNMQNQQAAEFERIHAQQRGGGANWNAEFAQQNMQPAQMQGQPAQMGAQPMMQNAWAAEFSQKQAGPMAQGPMSQQFQPQFQPQMGMPMMGQQMPMMGMQSMQNMMMGNMNMPMMGGMGMMQQNLGGQTMTQEASMTETKTSEPIAKEPEVAAPVVEEPAVAPAPMSMGMGMDAAMLEKLKNSGEDKWKNSKFLKFLSKIQNGEVQFKDNQVVEATPQPIAAAAAPAQAAFVGDEWAAEFDTQEGQMLDKDKGAMGDFIDGNLNDIVEANPESRWLQNEMQKMTGGTNAEMQQWMNSFQQNEGKEAMGDFDWAREQSAAPADPTYSFAEQNQFIKADDPYAEGVRLLKAGRLKEAIKAFEAAVQQQPDNADAWRYLGQAQAENEDEQNAIAALLKCIEIDPYNLPALLMLGVSYTNDLEETRALGYLKTWMVNNPDYQGTEVMEQHAQLEEYEEFYGGESGFNSKIHEEVAKMFIKATQINPNDADVYCVLGVLYHISSDFDKAIDAFRNAVRINPKDPTLWNKLGATQANSQKSSEAVSAYKNALQLRPTYVRALANLAIAFANQGLHEDAVRTYLATLAQNPNADHVWSYLRISLSNMDRPELVKLTEQKNVESFRQHFQF